MIRKYCSPHSLQPLFSMVQIRGQSISCRLVHCPPQQHGLQHQVHKGAIARWHTALPIHLHKHQRTRRTHVTVYRKPTHTDPYLCKRQLQPSPPTQYVGGAYSHEASIRHGHTPPPLIAEGRRWLTSKTP